MKKFLAILLGALFVLGIASSAFAIHSEIPDGTQAVVAKGTSQITLGGLYRVRGWYRDNLSGNVFGPNSAPVDVGSSAKYDQRLRFLMTAKVNDNVTGHFTMQKDWNWGSFNQKADNNNAADIIEAWMLYTGSGLLGVPAGMKIGHMPLALGEKTFFSHTTNGDDAIVLFVDPTKQLHIGALTIKLDGDGGAGGLNTSLGAGDTEADNTDDLDGYVGLLVYKHSDAFNMGVNWTYLNLSDADLAFHNVGLHANGKVGGFGYRAEGNMQFGDFLGDTDAGGWSILADLSYNFNPVTVRAGFGYGSGDDDAGDGDADQFVNFLDSGLQHVFNAVVYEFTMNTTAGATNQGLTNTTVYNLGLDWKATPALTTRLDGYLFYASETASNVDDSAGWEIDAGLVYGLAKNLNYTFDIGYFDTGDFYEDTYGDTENVTVIRQQLILSF